MAVDERLCEPRSVPEARIDLALESDVAGPLSSARSLRAPHDMRAARASHPQPCRGNSIDARELN